MSEVNGQFIYSEELYRLAPRTIVLLPNPWNELSDNDRALLGKILGAARLSLAGVQLLTTSETSLHNLKPFNPQLIIAFGTRLVPETEFYHTTQEGETTLIRSHSLSELDDARKKNLWGALKQFLSR